MFFKKTRTKRLIKSRYTKSRKRNSTNRQLEVWDSSLLKWVLLVSILDQFPDQLYAYGYFESRATLVKDAPDPEVPESIADEWLEREPIKEPTEISSFESDILVRPSVSGGYSSDNYTSSSDTGYSSSNYSSSSSCGEFD